MLCEMKTKILSAPSKHYPQLQTLASPECSVNSKRVVVSSESLLRINLEPTTFKVRNRGNRAVSVRRGDPSIPAAFLVF